MPIRTRRGRTAAYRALWEWPLYSARRLVGCLVVLLAIGLAVGFAVTARSGESPEPMAASRPEVVPATTVHASQSLQAGVASALPTPAAELTPASYPPAAAPPQALAAAVNWVTAWADHPAQGSFQAWYDRLRPYTTDEYLIVLSTVDVNNIPATRVTGPASAVTVRDASVSVDVPTDTVRLRLLVINTGAGGWKVAGYDKAS